MPSMVSRALPNSSWMALAHLSRVRTASAMVLCLQETLGTLKLLLGTHRRGDPSPLEPHHHGCNRSPEREFLLMSGLGSWLLVTPERHPQALWIPTTSGTLCRMPHLNNKQNKNTNSVISRQDYHLTQPCPSEEKQTNKQKLSTNLTLYKVYTDHWTNFRRADTKRKIEFNLEAWEKENSNTIS